MFQHKFSERDGEYESYNSIHLIYMSCITTGIILLEELRGCVFSRGTVLRNERSRNHKQEMCPVFFLANWSFLLHQSNKLPQTGVHTHAFACVCAARVWVNIVQNWPFVPTANGSAVIYSRGQMERRTTVSPWIFHQTLGRFVTITDTQTHTVRVCVCVSVFSTAAPCAPTNQPSTTNMHPLPKMMRPQKKRSGQDDTNDLADRLDCWALGKKCGEKKKKNILLRCFGWEWHMQHIATHLHLFPGFCATCWKRQSVRQQGWRLN